MFALYFLPVSFPFLYLLYGGGEALSVFLVGTVSFRVEWQPFMSQDGEVKAGDRR